MKPSWRNRRRSPSCMPISPSRATSHSKAWSRNSARLLRADCSSRKQAAPDDNKPGLSAGLFDSGDAAYLETRSLDSEVPIELNTAAVWLADVTTKKFSGPLAQYCSTAEVGSAGKLVLTWTVYTVMPAFLALSHRI